MAESIYTKEEVNGARLAALLINEGTEAVRQKFKEELKRQKITLDTFLGKKKSNFESQLKQKQLFPEQYALMYPSANLDRFDLELLMLLLEQLSGKTLSKSKPPASDGEEAVRTKIQETLQEKRTTLNEFLKTKKKNMTKLKNSDRLHWRHYELLYPIYGYLETFDLTLLFKLFKVLSINAPPTSGPSGTDESLEADLHRMRIMRNKIYGHVNGTGVDDDVFDQQWTTISSVLIRLGVKKKRISRWKQDAITTNDVEGFKKRLVEVMENDMGDMTALLHIILSEVQEGRLKIETLATQLKENESNVEDCRKMLRWLVTAVPPTKLLHLIEIIDANQHKHAETVKEIREMKDEVLRKLDMVNVKPETIYVQETPSLSEMSSIYENHPDAFKILIISAPQPNQDQESLDRFCKAVGECKWNIVLDLDEHSRSSEGMFDRITPVFSKRIDYTVLTYEQIQARVKDEDKDMVAQGKLSLWILANGCSFSKCPPSTGHFSKVLTKFGSLLDNILDRTVQKPPVICTSIALSDAARQPMYRLTERINEICESAQQDINYEATSFIAVHTDGNAPRAKLQGAPNYLHSEASMEQLTTRFENTFGTSCKEAKYWYPGQKEWCYMKCDEMAVLTSCMTLYHKDIGKAPFEALNTQEEVDGLIQSTKIKFLHGEKITPEALYINETTQTFVKRREMRQLNENVAKLLEKRGNKLERPATSFNLFHDVSGGGTTCGRYLLYALKDTYPCIEIEEINSPKLLEGLRKIYYSSRKPLLIVIDDSKVSDDETATFVNRLNNDFIKALVVIIKPKINPTFSTTRHGGTDRGFYVKSKVTDPEDLVAFKNLYHQNKGLNVQKVFLFGLLEFTEEYDKLDETVQACYENSDEDQQRVLRLTCLLWRYSHKATPMKAVLKLMRSKDIFNEDDLIEALGSGSDLLVATGKGIRPAHLCIVKALMRCVDEDTLTSMFVTDLTVLVQKDTAKKRASSILHSIFIDRTIEDKNWSRFVLALIKLRGKDYGASVIQQFIEPMEGTITLLHMKALFARYMMYNLDKPDEALNMAKEALLLKPSDSVVNSQSKDSNLLTTYGNLVRERVKRMFPKSGDMQVVTTQLLEKALMYIQEAICAYQEAQRLCKGTLYNARPFVMEARVRYEVMSLFFIHQCNEDHIQFSDFIKGTSIDLLRESEEKAMDALDRLDFFRKLDKISDGRQESKTKQVELETKFDFLRLRTDKDSTIRKQILTIPSDVPCDIAEIVRCDKIHRRRKWKDLHKEELELIIQKLDERMAMPNALSANYEGIINAMVCLRSRTKQADKYKFNIHYAHQCAESWKRKFKHNFDAWFMHGVLTLLLGMEQHKVSEIREALVSLNKCREICRNRDSIEGYRGRRYIIGEGSGLEKLVPFSEADTVGKGQLELFIGRQINKAEIVVSDFEYTLKVKVPKSEDVSFTQQEQLVQFNMVLARDNILAMNVEIYEREAD